MSNEGREWRALYLCAACGHSDEPYVTDRGGKRECRVLPIECGNKHCGCQVHMAVSFTIEEPALSPTRRGGE